MASVGQGLQAFPSPLGPAGVLRPQPLAVGRGVGRGFQGVARGIAAARGLQAARAQQFYGESPAQWNAAFNRGYSGVYGGGQRRQGVGRGLMGV